MVIAGAYDVGSQRAFLIPFAKTQSAPAGERSARSAQPMAGASHEYCAPTVCARGVAAARRQGLAGYRLYQRHRTWYRPCACLGGIGGGGGEGFWGVRVGGGREGRTARWASGQWW